MALQRAGCVANYCTMPVEVRLPDLQVAAVSWTLSLEAEHEALQADRTAPRQGWAGRASISSAAFTLSAGQWRLLYLDAVIAPLHGVRPAS